MPIEVNCPECNKRYTLADKMRGKTGRCKRCQAMFVIRGSDEDRDERPRKKAKDRPARSAPRAKSRRPLIIAAAAAGSVLFVLCGGSAFGIYYAIGRAKRAVDDPLAMAQAGKPNASDSAPDAGKPSPAPRPGWTAPTGWYRST